MMMHSFVFASLSVACLAFVPAQYNGLIPAATVISESAMQPRPQVFSPQFPTLVFKDTTITKSARGVSHEASQEAAKPASLLKVSVAAASSSASKEGGASLLAAEKTATKATQLPANNDGGILDGQKRTFEQVPGRTNQRCDKNTNGGIIPGIMSTSDPTEQITTSSVEECQDKCDEINACEYITYYTGDKFKGRCIMTNWCADYPRSLNSAQGYQSVVYKKACICIHRYPDVPCTCQKPRITIPFPDMNSGLDSVYDPMNPSANNNMAATL